MALVLVTGLAAGFALSGCAGTRIKQLSGKAFLEKAEGIRQMNSFVWYHYIGASSQRAYLEYGHPAFIGNGISTTVYWTPLSELPASLVTQLNSGNPPWTNWPVSPDQRP